MWWEVKTHKKRRATLLFSSTSLLRQAKPSLMKKFLFALPFALHVLVISCAIVALARPMSNMKKTIFKGDGIEIIICLDISESMVGEDLKPNRLEVAKANIVNFIAKRRNDKIGLVLFGKEAFLQCPLTTDHNLVKEFVENTTFIPELKASTAIGMALSTAILALGKDKVKSKIIILVTDGMNNSGDIDPITASKLASVYGIKIYCIGIGKPGISRVMVTQFDPQLGKRTIPMQIQMEEKSLIQIADNTKGIYFNVKDKNKLEEVYNTIDNLEKNPIYQSNHFSGNQEFYKFLLLALLLYMIEKILAIFFLQKIP